MSNPNDELLNHGVAMVFHGGGTGIHNGGGTFVGDTTTIITADHVYIPDSTELILRDSRGDEMIYSVADLTVEYLGGDLSMITLPAAPSTLLVSPSTTSSGYAPALGDTVVTAAYDWSKFNEAGGWTVTFKMVNTKVVNPRYPITSFRHPLAFWDARNGFWAENNAKSIVGGSSGGGVYYQGQLVGVNESIWDIGSKYLPGYGKPCTGPCYRTQPYP